jgi:hypothetical protein
MDIGVPSLSSINNDDYAKKTPHKIDLEYKNKIFCTLNEASIFVTLVIQMYMIMSTGEFESNIGCLTFFLFCSRYTMEKDLTMAAVIMLISWVL